MYDHNSSVPFSHIPRVRQHIESGFVTFISHRVRHTKFDDGYTFGVERFMKTAQGLAYKVGAAVMILPF